MALLSVLKANLKSKKGTFFSVFFLLFLIIFSLLTVVSISLGTSKRHDEASEHANIPDLIYFVDLDMLPKDIDIKSKLEEDSSIERINITPKVFASSFEVLGKEINDTQALGVYDPVAHPYEIYNESGTAFLQDHQIYPKEGEVFLPIGCKDRLKCELGDTITYKFANGSKAFRIVRFIEEPSSGCTVMGIKNAFFHEKDFEILSRFEGKEEAFIEAYYTEENEDTDGEILKRLNKKVTLTDVSSAILGKTDSKMYTTMFTNILSGVLWAFAILLFVIILIITGFSVNMSIEMDYASFGILKSQGFTTNKLRLILLLQYLMSGGIGCVLGAALSGYGVAFLSQIFVPIVGLLITSKVEMLYGLLIIVAMLSLLALYIIGVTRKIKKISPVQAMNGGIKPVHFNHRLYFDLSKINPVPLSIRMTLRNLFGNFKQYISMVLVMAILLFFLVSTASMGQLKSYENISGMFGGKSGEIGIAFQKEVDQQIVEEIVKEVEKTTPVKKKFATDSRYFTVDGLSYLGVVTDDMEVMSEPFKGRVPEYENEIMLAEVLSNLLSKGIGDTVEISTGDHQEEYMVVGINQEVSDVGKCFGIMDVGVKRIDPDYRIKNVDITIEEIEKTEEITTKLKEKYGEGSEEISISNQYKEVLDQFDFMVVAIDGITVLIYMLALFFVGIITFIICSKVFVRERIDMGILKSLGFSTPNIRGQFTMRFLAVSIVGSAIGIVTNRMWGDQLLGVLFTGMGMSRFVTEYHIWDYIGPAMFICGFTIVFSWISSNRIKRVSPKNLIHLKEE